MELPGPKPKSYDRLNDFVKEISKKIFWTDKFILYYKCYVILRSNVEKLFTLIQHIKTAIHIPDINLGMNISQRKINNSYLLNSRKKTIEWKLIQSDVVEKYIILQTRI